MGSMRSYGVSEGPYQVSYVHGSKCPCGKQASYRVVDVRKKYGERYPRFLQCKPCAQKDTDAMNGKRDFAVFARSQQGSGAT